MIGWTLQTPRHPSHIPSQPMDGTKSGGCSVVIVTSDPPPSGSASSFELLMTFDAHEYLGHENMEVCRQSLSLQTYGSSSSDRASRGLRGHPNGHPTAQSGPPPRCAWCSEATPPIAQTGSPSSMTTPTTVETVWGLSIWILRTPKRL